MILFCSHSMCNLDNEFAAFLWWFREMYSQPIRCIPGIPFYFHKVTENRFESVQIGKWLNESDQNQRFRAHFFHIEIVVILFIARYNCQIGADSYHTILVYEFRLTKYLIFFHSFCLSWPNCIDRVPNTFEAGFWNTNSIFNKQKTTILIFYYQQYINSKRIRK